MTHSANYRDWISVFSESASCGLGRAHTARAVYKLLVLLCGEREATPNGKAVGSMNKKLGLLLSSFALFLVTSFAALAIAQGGVSTMGVCVYQYTQCSDNPCGEGPGADGEHVYHCDTYPFIRVVYTCCGG